MKHKKKIITHTQQKKRRREKENRKTDFFLSYLKYGVLVFKLNPDLLLPPPRHSVWK